MVCIANVALHIALDALLDTGQPLDGRLLFALNCLGGLNSIKVSPLTVTHSLDVMHHELLFNCSHVQVNFVLGNRLRTYICSVKWSLCAFCLSRSNNRQSCMDWYDVAGEPILDSVGVDLR